MNREKLHNRVSRCGGGMNFTANAGNPGTKVQACLFGCCRNDLFQHFQVGIFQLVYVQAAAARFVLA